LVSLPPFAENGLARQRIIALLSLPQRAVGQMVKKAKKKKKK